MDCTESITLLSEFHDGALDETLIVQIRTHLDDCPPCGDLYRELEEIVARAIILREYQEIAFPDEQVLWVRMGLADRQVQ